MRVEVVVDIFDEYLLDFVSDFLFLTLEDFELVRKIVKARVEDLLS